MRAEIEAQFRAEAREEYLSSLPLLTIPAASNPARFAVKYRRIGQGASPLAKDGPIPYSFERFPFLREPHEQATAPEVQILALEFASAMGKSEISANVIGYVIKEAPCNVMVAYPKEDSVAKFSRDVVQRSLIDPTPAVRELVNATKSRDGGNTINYKRFAGGSLYMVGAGAPANFRGPRCGMVYGGEIDGMEDTSEGDPVALLLKRCEGFPDSIKILEGTPTLPAAHPRGRIEQWMAKSDRRKWYVPCRRCGMGPGQVGQVFMWNQVVWPKLGKNRHEKAEILCAHCAAAHNDAQRIRAILEGLWRPTQDFTGIRGYWLNGINTTLPPEKGFKNKLHQMAVDAHNAADTKAKKRVWENTFLAEPTTEESDDVQDWRILYDRREEYPVAGMPIGVRLLSLGTDVQQDRIEAEISGHGEGEESWGIENAVFFGDPRFPDVWNRLEAWAYPRTFRREDGALLSVSSAGFDTGYPTALRTEYEFIRPRQNRNWHAMKGASQIEAEFIAVSRKTRVARVSLKIVGTHRLKDLIYDRVLLDTPGPGFMHFPGGKIEGEGKLGEVAGYNEEWFKQLLSETPYPEFKAGVRYRRFKHEKRKDGVMERNEKLDIRVYALAALYARGPINWEAVERANLRTIVSENAAKQTVLPVRGFRQSGGFRRGGGGWRG